MHTDLTAEYNSQYSTVLMQEVVQLRFHLYATFCSSGNQQVTFAKLLHLEKKAWFEQNCKPHQQGRLGREDQSYNHNALLTVQFLIQSCLTNISYPQKLVHYGHRQLKCQQM
ncbi:hypothetical protein SCA6_002291 [Theobroma cacao]